MAKAHANAVQDANMQYCVGLYGRAPVTPELAADLGDNMVVALFQHQQTTDAIQFNVTIVWQYHDRRKVVGHTMSEIETERERVLEQGENDIGLTGYHGPSKLGP